MDYKNGKIYRLVSATGKQYIGSTTQPLYKRLGLHKQYHKEVLEGRRTGITSFDLFEEGGVQIFLLEDYPCERKEQLHARERHWIENTTCVNKLIPTRTLKEYAEVYKKTHKDYLSQTAKQYHQDHKEEIHARKAVKISCGCGSIISKSNLSSHLKTKKHIDWNPPQNINNATAIQ